MTDPGLQRAYRSLRWRLWLRRGLEAAAVAACIATIVALAGTSPANIAVIAAAAWGLAYLGFGMRPVYRDLSPAVFAEHLDRRFPALEESTGLMLTHAGQLPLMRQLQRARVASALPSALAERRTWLPPATRATTLWVLFAAGVVTVLAAPIRSAMLSTTAPSSTSQAVPADSGLESMIVSTDVRIEPPAYTGIDAYSADSLDLELPEGSTVTWEIKFRRPGRYALVIGDEAPVVIDSGPGDTHVARVRVDRTSLYRIVTGVNGSEQTLAGIHTLSVALDKPPRVRIVEPDETTLEIERDATPRFGSEVEVRDDFGVGPVEVRASIARGSGEGVKFRDEIFGLDAQPQGDEESSANRSYSRAWDLGKLGMEPGDEAYFFVVARDNREPQPNVARSDTLVVRWRDEEPELVSVGDLAIDVMPDYYKSQRQIIIETEQLVADRDGLEPETFAATSRRLGEWQAELKSRLGQYVGDEFNESLDGDVDLPELAESLDDEAVAEAGDDHDHGDHAAAGEPGADRPGSAEALLARYIHTHEAAEIGPITDRNPVGLMKRALANMWRAELQLRLAEPARSLPYQYEALKYYNRAREADRIFTQRLGFEPPPVSEERRLTGDIEDVQSGRLEETAAANRSDDRLFRELHDRLSRRSPTAPFSPDELELLGRAAGRLQELSTDRPALITQAATLERLRVAGAPANDLCADCLADVLRTALLMLASPQATPVNGTRPVAVDDALIRDYVGLGTDG
ncbi:MAG: hypothetical protein P8X98_15270 [Woeseiaceae bacterium]